MAVTALTTGDLGGIAVLIAAFGGVSAAFVGVREYHLKVREQRVEADIRLSQLLAELMDRANGWGASQLSDAAAEKIAEHLVSEGVTGRALANGMKGAVVTFPVGAAQQAVAIATIGYLGREHDALREPAYQALRSLEFSARYPQLSEAKAAALAVIERKR